LFYHREVRELTQPEVLRRSAATAAIGCVLCFPRLWLWPARKHPLWYLEAVLFLGGTVLWAFIFAWHSQYTGQPVFRTRIQPILSLSVTMAGITMAALLFFLVDPVLKNLTPAEYPKNFMQWVAMTLFSLSFTQVFLVFAPFAWLMRLFSNRSAAIGLTTLFGVVVLVLKNHFSLEPVPMNLLSSLLAVRVATAMFTIYCYLQGGIFLVWWWVLLLESRHLATFGN
jgi:hypothetical protein